VDADAQALGLGDIVPEVFEPSADDLVVVGARGSSPPFLTLARQ